MSAGLAPLPNMARGQSNGITLDGSPPTPDQSGPTYPGVIPGFTNVTSWAYPEWFTVDATFDLETIDVQVWIPTNVDAPTWQGWFDTIKANALGQGYTILGYEVDQEPATNITVPTEFCVTSTSCFQVPAQICIPFTSICIQVAGQTILTAYIYRIWLLVAKPTASPMAAVRPFLGVDDAIAVVILIIGVIVAVLAVQSIITGKLTLPGFVSAVQGLAQAPGQALVPVIQNAEWPLIAIGAIAIIAGVGIPALSLGGGLTGPGGVGGQAQVGIGATSAPLPSPSRQRATS